MRRIFFTVTTIALACAQESPIPPVIPEPSCCKGSSRTAAFALDLFAEEKAWKMADATAWKWQDSPTGKELHLIKQNAYKPPFRSPINLAWLESREWSSFSLTLECQLHSFTGGNNDLCIAFAGTAPDQFYYAHLGEKADEPHHQIHLVQKADRMPITTFRNTGTPWKKDTWHKVRIVRNADTGHIAVWFDDADHPILVAVDSTLQWGKIGLGSFDDEGAFRNIRIRGTSRKIAAN
jgi:hypothetical protein